MCFVSKVRKANFNADPFLQTFGININPVMCEVQGRVLHPPKLQYGGRVRDINYELKGSDGTSEFSVPSIIPHACDFA